MAGLAEWLRHWIVAPVTRVRFSHLAPNGRFVQGDYLRPATVKCEFESRTVHQILARELEEECWSEKPVDTVQFRDEPPMSGCRVAATHMPWEHVHAGSTPATRTNKYGQGS